LRLEKARPCISYEAWLGPLPIPGRNGERSSDSCSLDPGPREVRGSIRVPQISFECFGDKGMRPLEFEKIPRDGDWGGPSGESSVMAVFWGLEWIGPSTRAMGDAHGDCRREEGVISFLWSPEGAEFRARRSSHGSIRFDWQGCFGHWCF
jgi:hypothetical protein